MTVIRKVFEVNITEADIENGVPKCSNNCAVSEAIKRHFEDPRFVLVQPNGKVKVSCTRAGVLYFWIVNDLQFKDFIAAFDNGELVKPISVILAHMEEYDYYNNI